MMIHEKCINCRCMFLRPVGIRYVTCGRCKARLTGEIAQAVADALTAMVVR